MSTPPDTPVGFPLPPARFTGAARKVSAMRAFDWIEEGWALFLAAPRVWLFLGGGVVLAFTLTGFAWLNVRTAFAPSLPRAIVLGLLSFGPVLLMPTATVAGLHLCRLLARGDNPELSDLVAGLKYAPQRLLATGAVVLAGWLAIFAFYEVVGGPLALFLPPIAGFAYLIAIWFMPPLVAFHELSPLAALTKGFAACARNTAAFVVFGLLMALLHFVALLPAGLGLIVLLPVAVGALHASYRDVFPES